MRRDAILRHGRPDALLRDAGAMVEPKTISSFAELVTWAIDEDRSPGFVFRGESQPNPSRATQFDRAFDPSLQNTFLRLACERRLIQEFVRHAAPSLSPVELELTRSPLGTSVLMQHHSAPTRLLDWSKSSMIAAYFACSDDADKDGYVFGFDAQDINELVDEQTNGEPKWALDPQSSEWGLLFHLHLDDCVKELHPWAYCVRHQGFGFPRLLVQQSVFTIASKPQIDHWETICKFGRNSKGSMEVIQICSDAKSEILAGLATFGLTPYTLFPGLDGVGRHTRALCKYLHLEGEFRSWYEREITLDMQKIPPIELH